MHLVLLYAGIGLAIFALYRFFLKASPEQSRAFMQTALSLVLFALIIFLSVTGRFGLALGLSAVAIPMIAGDILGRMRNRRMEGKGGQSGQGGQAQKAPLMTRAEALEILGLEGEPSDEDVKKAHKEKMKKYHPDQGGDEYFARRLNEARDFLLKK